MEPLPEDLQWWLRDAEGGGHWMAWTAPRPGKRIGVFSIYLEQTYRGRAYISRWVMQVTERTIGRDGQAPLLPEVELEG